MTRARVAVQLAGATQVLVAALVITTAFAASHIYPWNSPGVRTMRWVALAELGAAAVALVLVQRRPFVRPLGAASALALGLLGVASAAWAADALLSLGRAVSFAALLAVALAIGVSTRGQARRCGEVLLAVLFAVTLIAVAGLVELWQSYGQAVVPATRSQGARYNGIGQNPNQVAMLLAIALPLALWAFVEAPTRRARAAAFALIVLFDASLVASGSRGAILGAFAGCALYALVSVARRRVLAVAAVTALFAANVLITQLPPRAATDPVLNPEFGATPKLAPRDVNYELPLESEFGFPERGAPPLRRKLVFSSGRRQAWAGALEQAGDRPLLGYGFGMEDRAFVDRYYLFVSSRVENSYLGMLLQLGPLGVVLLLLAIVRPLAEWVRVRARLPADTRGVAAAAAAVVAAGIVLAVPQSYLTSVGSPPTAPFWVAVALLGALTGAHGARRFDERERDERQVDAA